MTTRIVWTCLPNGLSQEKHLRFSLFAAPRLELPGDNLLSAFELGNFASRALAMELAVDFGGTLKIAKREPLAVSKWVAPSPELWAAVFPPDATYVRGHAFRDHGARPIRSFSARSVKATVHDMLSLAASQGSLGFPSLDPATSPIGALLGALAAPLGQGQEGPLDNPKGLIEIQNLTDEEVVSWVTGLVGDKALAPAAAEVFRAWLFYNRAPRHDYDDFAHPAIDLPKAELQEMLGMMGDHPTLLRALGLVTDWVIPLAFKATMDPPTVVFEDGTVVDAQSTLRVRELSAMSGLVLEVPATAYLVDPPGFFAASQQGSDLDRGFLRLAAGGKDPAYEVGQLDIDGGALKTFDLAVNLRRIAIDHPASAPSVASLPAARTSALTVWQHARRERMSLGFQRSKDLEAQRTSATLTAADVCRGYRVDVMPQSKGAWYSLCLRGGTLTVGTAHVSPAPADVEGYVKASGATSEVGAGAASRMYVHEALFGWDGWSLAARRPGRSIMKPSHVPAEGLGDNINRPAPGFRVVADYHAAPGTLPRLRLGESYRFRVRTVDLAGNGLSLAQKFSFSPADAESAWAPFLRYEPIPSPALVLLHRPTEGASLERMVLRSDLGVPADAYAAALVTMYGFAQTPEGQARYQAFDARHLAPPKVPQIVAEQHGKIDMFATAADKHHVSSKEEGTFFDSSIVDWKTGLQVAVSPVFVSPPPHNRTKPPPKGDPILSGEYVLHPEKLVLPYLPDPATAGVAFRGLLPTGDVLAHSYENWEGARWPDVLPSRIVIRESATATVEVASSNGVITVGLPKATILKVAYSSLPHPDEVAKLALWSAAVTASPSEAARAKLGQNWALSPARELVLVHAVQHPLEAPRVKWLAHDRRAGDTRVTLQGFVRVHGRSTGDLELEATWVDRRDRVDDASTGFRDEPHASRAFTLGVDYEDLETGIGIEKGNQEGHGLRHELGDTRHRNVLYQPVATTRYREYFPLEVIADAANITTPGDYGVGGVNVAADGKRPTQTTGMLSIPSSARPEPPRVLYVIPTFGWDATSDGSSTTRRGRGLRVYLDRPWFSSGIGERLGVVVAAAEDASPGLDRYVSQWGSDPIWSSFAPATQLAVTDFVDVADPAGETDPEVVYQRKLGPFTLTEDPALAAMVVGYAPMFHPERKLWFVDLELAPGASYMPFVRLALARLQPESVWPLHMSRIVKTQFAQLVPDRTATMTVVGSTLEVTVSGFSAQNVFAGVQATLPVPPGSSPPKGGPGGAVGASPATSAFSKSVGAINPGIPPLPIEFKDRSAGYTHRVTAVVQQRPTSDPVDAELDWRDVSAETTLDSFRELFVSEVLWRGSVPLPPAHEGYVHRVLFREYEQFYTDDKTATATLQTMTGPISYGERVVFAAALPLA